MGCRFADIKISIGTLKANQTEFDPDGDCVLIPLERVECKHIDGFDMEMVEAMYIDCSMDLSEIYVAAKIGDERKYLAWQPNEEDLDGLRKVLVRYGCYAK